MLTYLMRPSGKGLVQATTRKQAYDYLYYGHRRATAEEVASRLVDEVDGRGVAPFKPSED